MTEFALAPPDEWKLGRQCEDSECQMTSERSSNLLLATSFKEIVAYIKSEAKLHCFGCEEGECGDKVGKRR